MYQPLTWKGASSQTVNIKKLSGFVWELKDPAIGE